MRRGERLPRLPTGTLEFFVRRGDTTHAECPRQPSSGPPPRSRRIGTAGQERRVLEPLARNFDEWRAGSVSSDELTEIIQVFHSGLSRELFKFYNEPSPIVLAVAHPIVVGVLDEKETDKAVLSHLEPAM
jgi:hypothetical protein